MLKVSDHLGQSFHFISAEDEAEEVYSRSPREPGAEGRRFHDPPRPHFVPPSSVSLEPSSPPASPSLSMLLPDLSASTLSFLFSLLPHSLRLFAAKPDDFSFHAGRCLQLLPFESISHFTAGIISQLCHVTVLRKHFCSFIIY